ncbi:PaaI family thioesterase [Amycolatopsis sp.]|uniref:PaaI family thioesterase n=1 Tax=Amycolatopsis sp. TaxID=37632 RepID=UPI002C99D3A4|nr:PaaI family thioesterase [Amycolatopsis sp.]HVV11274.1 PaaI family thioesterase [Amycolatopsis sp.]
MDTVTSCHEWQDYRPGGPETMFAVDGVTVDGTGCRGSMASGPWMSGPENAAALGVLADNVLGYALIASAPPGRWSVSTEISFDFLSPPPSDGTRLSAEGRLVHSSPGTGLAEGAVFASDGRPVARCRQWGRFLDEGPAGPPGETVLTGPCRSAAALAGTVRENASAVDGRVRLSLPIEEDLVNPLRTLHGGITLWLTGLLAGLAVGSVGGPPVPASLSVSYLRPLVLGDVATFRAEITSSGRRLAVTQVTGFSGTGKPCIVALAHHHGSR